MADEAAKGRLSARLADSLAGRAAHDIMWGGPGRKAEALIGAPMAAVARMPGRLVGSGLGSVVFGRRNINPASPMFGKRLSAVRGGPEVGGMVPITKAEYNEIDSGRKPGKAYVGDVGGKRVYFKRRYVHGGMVGFGRKHPLLSAGGLLMLYLATNPSVRAAGSDMLPNLRKVHPGVRAQWAAPIQQATPTQAWGQ